MALFRRRHGAEDSLDPEDRKTLGWLRQQEAIGKAYAKVVDGALDLLTEVNGAPRTMPGRSPMYQQPPVAAGRLQDGLRDVTDAGVKARAHAEELFSFARSARTFPGDGWQRSADLMERVALGLAPELGQVATQLDPRFEEIRRHRPGLQGGPSAELPESQL